ncbi:hypothetical protein K7X08_027789 [Anisodus acutangulus]|uniref:Uncharacterized protein n=1 Tax=Anisodus acutangulus TaxID=402998 RepID=A0A9Q1R302_9SOLA|nr:hypothetical protein K7X08_027789 [Anisodus acutangulus]
MDCLNFDSRFFGATLSKAQGQLKKFVNKEITTTLKPLRLSTETSHQVLHDRLDRFEIRLASPEQSDSSSDTRSLQTELEFLRATVQELQASDHVTLEDPPLTKKVDILDFVTVYQLVEDEESPAATPTDDREKRPSDDDDELSDELRERTRPRGRSVEEQNFWLAT